MNILIIGNVIKDIYLDFDIKLFEMGREATPWIDVGLDNEAIHFRSRESVLSGATVAQEIFRNFGFTPELSRYEKEEEIGDDYRYVIRAKNKTKFLTSKNVHFSILLEPATPPDWIFVDRSARLRTQTIQNILKYLERNPKIKLAVCVKNLQISDLDSQSVMEPEKSLRQLLEKAKLVFSSGETQQPDRLVKCPNSIQITPRGIKTASAGETFYIKKETLTHLTIYSVAAATTFAALISGWTQGRALKLAKLNVENAKVSETLSMKRLSRELKQCLVHEKDMLLATKGLMGDKKGILAIDESAASIRKKMQKFKLDDSKKNCWRYRNLLITTPNLEKYINGVILSSETAEQKTTQGEKFVNLLTRRGILSGIKVDTGQKKMANTTELYTNGVEELARRLPNYYKQGFRFAKWRAVFYVGSEKDTSSAEKIDLDIKNLVTYTEIALRSGLVPILEPEVINVSAKTTDYAKKTSEILAKLFDNLKSKQIDVRKCILKMNMIYGLKNDPKETGRMTMSLIREVVPKEIGGIVFLSGGQSSEQTTENLESIMQHNRQEYPISFSFGRALQDPALKAWSGSEEKVELAREKLKEQLRNNCEALEF